MNNKLYFIGILLVTCFVKVNAQNASIGFGPEISLPTGSSSNISAIGFGGFIKAEVYISEKIGITAQGSVISFLGKRFFGSKTPTLSAIPLKAGLKYYTSPEFFFEGQLGAAIPINGKTNNSFAWSTGLGTYINKKGAKNKTELGLRYESWTNDNINFISLKLGYIFGL